MTTRDAERLIRDYSARVAAIAQQMRPRTVNSVDADDLYQAGIISLIESGQSYDPVPGVPFWSYARQRVRGAMTDELRRYDWLPRSVRRFSRERAAVIGRVAHRLGRTPSAREVARALPLTLDAYHARMTDRHAGFIEPYVDTASDEQPASAVADNGPALFAAPHAVAEARERRAALAAAMRALPERQRQIVGQRYYEDRRPIEIARRLGVSEGRVSQLHAQAIKRLRGDPRLASHD